MNRFSGIATGVFSSAWRLALITLLLLWANAFPKAAFAQTAMRLDYSMGALPATTTTAQALPSSSPVAPATGTSTVQPPRPMSTSGSVLPMSAPVASPSPTSAAALGTAAPGTATAPGGDTRMTLPQLADYAANLKSEVFGANLFTGAFAGQGATQFNPDYAVSSGDNIQVRFWGAFEYEGVLQVDAKGNIFLPRVGPVQLLGVKNKDIQRVVDSAASKVFRSNVFNYASLAASQPVRVFVGGYVNRPGLYGGTSMDSLLHYLDQAGGIDPQRGSFLNVQVKRGGQVRSTVNLYDFLLDGRMPLVQLADGDVIFVSPRQQTVRASGLVENAKRFEFDNATSTVADIARVAKPLAQATHVRVTRNSLTLRSTEYYPLSSAASVTLQNGDEIELTSDKLPGTITVRVEGEHLSAQEYVLPYGSKIGDVLKQVQLSERSDAQSVQLFRLSVKERQRALLQTSLNSLQSAALTARSGTSDEARLRKDEADLLLQWVDRARLIEPSGQVLIARQESRDSLLLENGDLLKIPVKDGLVLISGEVLFPNAVAFNAGLSTDDYIRRAGGYTQNADSNRIIIAHRDGSFDEVQDRNRMFGGGDLIRSGDEILVLPKIDEKSRQIWKDLTQIIYQIAVSAKVVLGL